MRDDRGSRSDSGLPADTADSTADDRSSSGPRRSRREFLYAGLTLAVGGAGVGIWASVSDSRSQSGPGPTATPSASEGLAAEVPQPRIRWSLRSDTEGWQAGPDAPRTQVVTDPAGWLLAIGANRVQVSSFGSAPDQLQDWRLPDRPNADRVTVSAHVGSTLPTAYVVITMVWSADHADVSSASLQEVDSVAFEVPTNLDIDVDTWWHCRGTAPADVLERVVGIRVRAVSPGNLTLRVRDVRQPPTTASYGPAPYGVATVFTAARPRNPAAPQPADAYAVSVLARLDIIAAWGHQNNRAVHIGEWAWPKETRTQIPGASASQTAWAHLAEQWMRKADELAIPYTPWGETAYWGGVQASTGTNYGSYPDASYFCADPNYNRNGELPRVVNGMKPSAAPLAQHMNAVEGIKPSINVAGGCFVYLKDGTQYSSTNIGKRGSDYFIENPATIDYLHSVGWRIFRMPFRWDRVMRTPDASSLDASEWGYVKEGIEYILSLPDTAVIVDQHSSAQFWISPSPEDRSVPAIKHVVDGPDRTVTTANYVNFWKLVSSDLRSHSARLVYEITNEPHGTGANPFTVKRYTQAVVSALREQGDTTFCLIPSFPYDNIASAITEPNQPFAWISDPAGSHRHAYTFHHYMDSDFSGGYHLSYQEEAASHRQ